MAEQLAEPTPTPTPADIEKRLVTDLRCLTVRGILFQDIRGAGLTGAHTPTPAMWRAGRHLAIGEDIDHLVRSGDAAIHLTALSDRAIQRRVRDKWPITGKPWIRFKEGVPIEHAGVTGVENVPAGWGRTLPVLKLLEFNNRGAEDEFALSLPDLAHYVQGHEVEVTVT